MIHRGVTALQAHQPWFGLPAFDRPVVRFTLGHGYPPAFDRSGSLQIRRHLSAAEFPRHFHEVGNVVRRESRRARRAVVHSPCQPPLREVRPCSSLRASVPSASSCSRRPRGRRSPPLLSRHNSPRNRHSRRRGSAPKRISCASTRMPPKTTCPCKTCPPLTSKPTRTKPPRKSTASSPSSCGPAP